MFRDHKFAVIAGLVLGLGFGFINFETMQHGARGDDSGLAFFHRQSAAIASELKRYKTVHGHYPSNNEDLSPVLNAAKCRMGVYGRRVRFAPSGFLSWWGDPLIYENHQGQSPRKFIWSSASNDPHAGYSHQVDDGIYVWSIGAKIASQKVASRNLRYNVIIISSLIFTIALLVLYVATAMRKLSVSSLYKKILYGTWFTLTGIFIVVMLALLPATFPLGCGCPGCQTCRTPELTKAYVITMQKARNQGVISNSTLDRIKINLEKDEKCRDYYKR